MAQINYVSGDTLPAMIFDVKFEDGSIVDLTGCTVRVNMKNKKTSELKIQDGLCSITNSQLGIARYTPINEDTSEGGAYQLDISVIFPSGGKQTNFKPVEVVIRNKL